MPDLLQLTANLGVAGILAWYLWYTIRIAFPAIESRHREERTALEQRWKEERGKFMASLNKIEETVRFQCLLISMLRRNRERDRKSILIVEDNLVDVRMLTEHIKQRPALASFTIEHATSLLDSLAKLRHAAFIVCDILLPDSTLPQTAGLLVTISDVPGCVYSGTEPDPEDLRLLKDYRVPFFDKNDLPSLISFMESSLS